MERSRSPVAPIVFLGALVLAPALFAVLWESGADPRWSTGARVAWVSRDVVLLFGTAVIYLNWRMSDSAALGWFATALGAASLHLLVFDLVLLSDQSSGASLLAPSQSPDLTVVLVVPVLAVLAARATPLPRSCDPLALAVGIGLVTIGLRLALLVSGHALHRIHDQVPLVLTTLLAALGLVAIVVVARTRSLPARTRGPSTFAAVLLVGAQTGTTIAPDGAAQTGLAALGVLGAVAVTVGATSLCANTALTVRASAHLLDTRVAQAEERVNRDAEMLHELRSTVAGVTKATGLLRQSDLVLPHHHRVQLQSMIDRELSRMERLLDARPPARQEVVALDEVIEPLVVAHRALGHEVGWRPSGHRALGVADDIAEALHVLLSNAGRHAPHAPVTVTVAPTAPGRIGVRVADSGPGLDPSLRGHLFERGARGHTSHGEGIGLHLARRLVRDSGGDLLLETAQPGRGCTFLLCLHNHTEEVTT